MDCPICKVCNTTQENINSCAAKLEAFNNCLLVALENIINICDDEMGEASAVEYPYLPIRFEGVWRAREAAQDAIAKVDPCPPTLDFFDVEATTMTDKTCCCFEIAGDNENCPVHNDPRTDEEKEQDERDADWSKTTSELRNGG